MRFFCAAAIGSVCVLSAITILAEIRSIEVLDFKPDIKISVSAGIHRSGAKKLSSRQAATAGWRSLSKGNTAEAERLFRQALRRSPKLGDALEGMAYTLCYQDQYSAAIPYATRAVNAKDLSAPGIQNFAMGMSEYHQGKSPEAWKHLKKYLTFKHVWFDTEAYDAVNTIGDHTGISFGDITDVNRRALTNVEYRVGNWLYKKGKFIRQQPGIYQVEVISPGYENFRATIKIVAGQTYIIHPVLTASK